ncbi:flagellar biosynthesis protein FlhG [Alteribacillus persepolensis]|uniref:Flagellar biosynthesis protein FlhG n=1 Tax=Alteribacillus persepolensis TaxID=568899 RepID=A0A1G7YPX5_9BACI|nr:MinD/ParA family protein [Alteribacillus persepolensis]SDG98487.1 flagellar biosynthesis protein FlhG [Alteribacillus persepolensis]
MSDQAQHLRHVVKKQRGVNKRHTSVVAVISGKGGVGKSNVSLNFALALQQQGKKVLLFDLDIGMANLDILMGITPQGHIVDVLEHNKTMFDIMEKGPEGVSFIAGGSGLAGIFSMSSSKRERFSQQMALLDGLFDIIILDMGAGASEDSLQFILSSHETLLVTTPEPTAIMDAYAMLKYIHQQNPRLPSSIVVNRTDSKKEGMQVAANLERAAARFLQKNTSYLGSIPYDKHAVKAVKQQEAFVLSYPQSPAAKAMRVCANTFLGQNKSLTPPRYAEFLQQLKGFFKRGGTA